MARDRKPTFLLLIPFHISSESGDVRARVHYRGRLNGWIGFRAPQATVCRRQSFRRPLELRPEAISYARLEEGRWTVSESKYEIGGDNNGRLVSETHSSLVLNERGRS
jgi:hypothetical protein